MELFSAKTFPWPVKWISATWRATSVQMIYCIFRQNCLWFSKAFKIILEKSPKERLVTQYGSTSRSPDHEPSVNEASRLFRRHFIVDVTCSSMPFTAVSALISDHLIQGHVTYCHSLYSLPGFRSLPIIYSSPIAPTILQEIMQIRSWSAFVTFQCYYRRPFKLEFPCFWSR